MKKSIVLSVIFMSIALPHLAARHHLKSKPKLTPTLAKKAAPKAASYNKNRDRVVCVSIPKCGTHLLVKCLTLFQIPGISFGYEQPIKPSPEHLATIREINKNPPPNHFKGMFHIPTVGPLPSGLSVSLSYPTRKKAFWTHWPYTREFSQLLDRTAYANFLIVRDPRDMVVSFAHMVGTGRNGELADINRVIIDLITGKQEYYIPWAVEIQEAYPILWEKGLYGFYKLYTPWLSAQNFKLVKFEHLVGPQGGGSAELQLQEIMDIGTHLGVKMTVQKAREVIQNLFGGTWTFREGQIGSWKKHFTPEIKAAFQADKKLMQLLIDLGYENDNNW